MTEQRVGWALYEKIKRTWVLLEIGKRKGEVIDAYSRECYKNCYSEGDVKIVPVYATPPEGE